MRSGWPAGSQEKNSAEAVESVLLACGRGGKQARPLYGLAIGLDGRLREPATAAFPLTGHCGSRNATEAHYAQVACRNSRDVLSKRWIHWALARWHGIAAVHGAFAGTDRRVSHQPGAVTVEARQKRIMRGPHVEMCETLCQSVGFRRADAMPRQMRRRMVSAKQGAAMGKSWPSKNRFMAAFPLEWSGGMGKLPAAVIRRL